MANSVKVNTSNDSKVAAVVNMLRHPNNKLKVLCIVEGDDDVICYSGLADISKVKFYATGGCLALEYAMQKLHKGYARRTLAIRDADFGRLNGQSPSYDNVFWTDYHDIEMMLLDGGRAYEMCQKYCYGKHNNGILIDILNELQNVSYTRWFSQIMHDDKGQQGLCFDEAPICQPIYTATAPIALKSYWTYLCSKQKITIPYSLSDVRFFISHNSSADVFQLTNGHEAIDALWCKIKIHYILNLAKKTFIKEIQTGYTIHVFKRTRLYKSVNKWLAFNNIPSIWIA